MSLNIEGQKCVICGAYLFEEDDIVYCPDCGAPHHRDCYMSVGHCGLAQTHGTAQEYKRPEPTVEQTIQQTAKRVPMPAERPDDAPVCSRCGRRMAEDAKFCPYCGMPNLKDPITGAAFGILGGIDGQSEIDEGVTAAEAANVVMANTARYIPKFRSLQKEHRLSWNWAAFLLPHAWFGFRKMYGACVISSVLMVISSLFTLPMLYELTALSGGAAVTYAELGGLFLNRISDIGSLPSLLMVLSSLLNLGVRIFSALFGDWLYKKSVVTAVKKIREADDGEMMTRRLGGLNAFAFAAALFAVSFIPEIIALFIG